MISNARLADRSTTPYAQRTGLEFVGFVERIDMWTVSVETLFV